LVTLLINLALCLIVLVIPSLLAGYTAALVYEYGSLRRLRSLVLANVVLAVSIVSLVVNRQVSTLTAMAVTGYVLATVMVVAILIGMLLMRLGKYISTRSRVRLPKVREERGALPESSLPY
jgi:hypothetical protein